AIRQDLQKNLKRINNQFEKEIKEYIEALKINDPNIRLEIKKELKKKGRTGFTKIWNTIADVEKDLTTQLIVLARDAFENSEIADNFEYKLQEVITPALAKDLNQSFNNVSRRISKFSKESNFYYRKVRADNSQEVIDLNNDEKCFRLLYYTMRQAITARAEFTLQTKAKEFEEALQSFVYQQLEELKKCLSQEELSSINLEQAIISDLEKKLAQNLPQLPDKLFELSDNIKQTKKKQREKIGTETYYDNVTQTKYKNEEYQEGSCFGETKTRQVPDGTKTVTEKRTRNKYDDVEYVELFLPTPKVMAQQWSDGVEKGKNALWDILYQWIINRLNYVANIFEESVIDITNLAERSLSKQLKIIELNFEEQKQIWATIEVEQK
ncbi:hypothetical protein ACN4EE_23660, partial [Geminocystis sp. CENA526]